MRGGLRDQQGSRVSRVTRRHGCHVSRVQECEDDKKFDDRYFWCAFPHDVECGARPCPDGNVHCPGELTTQATTQDCSVTPPINCEETGDPSQAAA